MATDWTKRQMNVILSEFQELAYSVAVRGEWLFSFDMFPPWVCHHAMTADRLYRAGLLERRGSYCYEYRVKDNANG